MFNSENLNPQQVVSGVQQGLVVIRSAMNVAGDLYAWSSGVSPTDLTALAMANGITMPLADAQQILSACADAYALNRFYNAGLPGASYPQPTAAYVYGASQRQVIGPRPV